jgi:hypothetical protein
MAHVTWKFNSTAWVCSAQSLNFSLESEILHAIFAKKKNPRLVARRLHIPILKVQAQMLLFSFAMQRERACTIYKWRVLSPKQPRQIFFSFWSNVAAPSSSLISFAQKKASSLGMGKIVKPNIITRTMNCSYLHEPCNLELKKQIFKSIIFGIRLTPDCGSWKWLIFDDFLEKFPKIEEFIASYGGLAYKINH